MSNKITNLIAFLLVVLIYSLPLYGGIIWSQSYIRNIADKPGIAEIRKIAQENNLKHSEVANALRPTLTGDSPLLKIMAVQAILVGLTLGLFDLIRRLISRISGQNNGGAQQGVPPYVAQGAPSGER